MRCYLSAILILLPILAASAKEIRDTVFTSQNDKIILTYNVTSDNNRLAIEFSLPRIIPSASSSLRKACKGELDKLKVVVFDRIGDFGKTKWGGMSPSAFMVPRGLAYENTLDGYYILGESQPMEFLRESNSKVEVRLPLYIAVYNKKQDYSIVSSGRQPLVVSSSTASGGRGAADRHGSETERIAVTSSVETENDNSDITGALASIDMVKELLSRETEFPFSQTLQMEIHNLRAIKNQIKDTEMVGRINEVLLLCDDRERELKDIQNQSALTAKAEEQAMMQQQKKEAEAQKREAEENARKQEEKQQKRTLWMIIGGAALAIVGFIGNAVFKHFRDIRNQKSIMEMQESLARQAEHEAGRRSREIVRNKAHQAVNKGKTKLRNSMSNTSGQPQTNKRRTI